MDERQDDGGQKFSINGLGGRIPMWIAIILALVMGSADSFQLIRSDTTPADVLEKLEVIEGKISSASQDRFYGYEGRQLRDKVEELHELLSRLAKEIGDLRQIIEEEHPQ